MQQKMDTIEFFAKAQNSRNEKIYETALLNNNEWLFNAFTEDGPRAVLNLARANLYPEVFVRALLQLENDLKLYQDKRCEKNRQGEFLKRTEVFVAGMYQKFPEWHQEILKRISNLIMDYYAEKNKKVSKF